MTYWTNEPAAVAAVLAGLPRPWAICGGWAIDLFLGRPTRPHSDVDVAAFRRDQFAVRSHLTGRGWVARKVVGGVASPWGEGEGLELPVHEIWFSSPYSHPSRIEILLNEAEGENFRFRRDPSITLPLGRAVLRSAAGLPCLAPEIVLLYKSKSPRPADDADFRNVLPDLDSERRAWLAGALRRADPRHPWLAEFPEGSGQ